MIEEDLSELREGGELRDIGLLRQQRERRAEGWAALTPAEIRYITTHLETSQNVRALLGMFNIARQWCVGLLKSNIEEIVQDLREEMKNENQNPV